MAMNKPIAVKINPHTSKIGYACRNCGCSLELLGTNAKYCYNCGLALSWENLPSKVPNKFKGLDLSNYIVHQEILNDINKI
jgi:hypothetical protein